ncbi:unnamed protein product [Ixodes hexagonus]
MKSLVPLLCLLVSCRAQDDEKLTLANNQFGLRLLKTLPSPPGENVFFSPYSVSTAMGMAYAGAKGPTQEELSEQLGYTAAGLTGDDVFNGFSIHTQGLKESRSNSTVIVANAAVIHDKVGLRYTFQRTIDRAFDADLLKVDFVDEREEAVDRVNLWVKDKTNAKIRTLFKRPLESETRLVLLNAIYFKGSWNMGFDKTRTEKRDFLNGGVTPTQVDMMMGSVEIGHRFFRDLQIDVADLPYQGKDYSMTVILPWRNDGVEEIKQNLTLNLFQSLVSKLRKRKVFVYLPRSVLCYFSDVFISSPVARVPVLCGNSYSRNDVCFNYSTVLSTFPCENVCSACHQGTHILVSISSSAYVFKLEAEYSLKEPLQNMGIRQVFSSAADLSGITNDNDLVVSAVVHKAVVEVNEEGSEAAAVTSVVAVTRLGTQAFEFNVDHPFLFFIRNTVTNDILFAGQVNSL